MSRTRACKGDKLARFDVMVRAGTICESVLWKSEEMNVLIEEHAKSVSQKIHDFVYVDLEHGVTPFSSILTANPLFGEKLLYTDIILASRELRHEYSRPIETEYGIGLAFNLNFTSPEDTAQLNAHNFAHLLADYLTFFTADNKAAGYGRDMTLGANGLKATFKCAPADSRDFSVGHISMLRTQPFSRTSFSRQ
jgi:hypothetical protein